MEIWKTIKDYEELYQVSDQGNVKSLNYGGWGKERLLKPQITPQGYYIVALYKNGKIKQFIVHRLVYQTFKGELIKGLVIDHISGIRTENNVENLQQISYRSNTIRGKRTKNGSSKYVGVSWAKGRYNKWLAQIMINGKIKGLGYFDSEEEAAQAYQNALPKTEI
jgi:hypothetical protein